MLIRQFNIVILLDTLLIVLIFLGLLDQIIICFEKVYSCDVHWSFRPFSVDWGVECERSSYVRACDRSFIVNARRSSVLRVKEIHSS